MADETLAPLLSLIKSEHGSKRSPSIDFTPLNPASGDTNASEHQGTSRNQFRAFKWNEVKKYTEQLLHIATAACENEPSQAKYSIATQCSSQISSLLEALHPDLGFSFGTRRSQTVGDMIATSSSPELAQSRLEQQRKPNSFSFPSVSTSFDASSLEFRPSFDYLFNQKMTRSSADISNSALSQTPLPEPKIEQMPVPVPRTLNPADLQGPSLPPSSITLAPAAASHPSLLSSTSTTARNPPSSSSAASMPHNIHHNPPPIHSPHPSSSSLSMNPMHSCQWLPGTTSSTTSSCSSSVGLPASLLSLLAHSTQSLPYAIPSVVIPKQVQEPTPKPIIETESKKERRKRRANQRNLQCNMCGATETPEWRRGPQGDHTLCNACGLHYAKSLKKGKQDSQRRKNSIEMLLNAAEGVLPAPLSTTTTTTTTTRGGTYIHPSLSQSLSSPPQMTTSSVRVQQPSSSTSLSS